MKKLNSLLLIAFSVLAFGCAVHAPVSSISSTGEQMGYASWYGEAFHGRKTASGEVYNMNNLTAAHLTLKFGTRVRVTRLDNGKQVFVRINDRGPYKKNRIIDLSAAAAKLIGLDHSGVAKVKVEVITETTRRSPMKNLKKSSYYLQVASFSDQKHAKTYAKYVQLLNKREDVQLAYLNEHHKVWVGPLYTAQDIAKARDHLKSNGMGSVILRRS